MKLTLDIPERMLRQAESLAATKGIPVTQLLNEALEEKLRPPLQTLQSPEPPWMGGFGALADLKDENQRIADWIDAEFEKVEPEDR